MTFLFFRRFVALFLLISVSGLQACSPVTGEDTEDLAMSEPIPPVEMVLSQIDKAKWKLDLKIPEKEDKQNLTSERVMIFSRSSGDYRAKRFKELLPVDSLETVEALGGDIDNWDGQQMPLPIKVITNNTLIVNGQYESDGEVKLTIQGGAPYVYTGPGRISIGSSFIGVVDSGLPSWILENFDDDLAQLFDFYEGAFGSALPKQSTLLFAFGGSDEPGLSNTGGVLPGGQIVLDVSGELMMTAEPRIAGYLKWFLAHEAAHLFQTNFELKNYSNQSDSWINEGGANAMVDVAFIRMDGIDEGVRQRRMGQAYDACVQAIQDSNMTKLIQQNDQSHYDCGQVLWWISDAAISQADIFGIWTEMVTSVTVEGQSSYDRELFFATLERLGADMGIMSDMQAILDGPNPNPDQTFRRLLESVNLSVEFQNGSLVYIAYPPQKG